MYLQGHKKLPFSIISHKMAKRTFPTNYYYDPLEAFNSLMKYIVKLRRDEDIDNDLFKRLVQQAAAIFIENEISERVDMVVTKKISLNRMLELF